MADTVIIHCKAANGQMAAFADFLRDALVVTRAFDGCLSVNVFVEEATGIYTLIEEWQSLDHYETYLSWRYSEGIKEMTTDLLDGGWDNAVAIGRLGPKLDI